MGESPSSSRLGPDFLVDNDLSPLIAKALQAFGFNVQTVEQALGSRDVKDEQIIPWLGSTQTVWITHDKKAKSRHVISLKANRVSLLCVRGDKLSSWDQFKIVVRVFDVLCEKLRKRRGAIHYRASLKSGPTPTVYWTERPEDRPRQHKRR